MEIYIIFVSANRYYVSRILLVYATDAYAWMVFACSLYINLLPNFFHACFSFIISVGVEGEHMASMAVHLSAHQVPMKTAWFNKWEQCSRVGAITSLLLKESFVNLDWYWQLRLNNKTTLPAHAELCHLEVPPKATLSHTLFEAEGIAASGNYA